MLDSWTPRVLEALLGHQGEVFFEEVTLGSEPFSFPEDQSIAYAGGIDLLLKGERLEPWFSHSVLKGEPLTWRPRGEMSRSYLARTSGVRFRGGVSSQLRRWSHPHLVVRCVKGPEYEVLRSCAHLLESDYLVTDHCNRQGMCLKGAELSGFKEMVSTGVKPGTVQLPAGGQPIILLGGCQATGGYPRIAQVIEVDLPRLAYLLPGAELQFEWVEQEEALSLWNERERDLIEFRSGVELVRPL